MRDTQSINKLHSQGYTFIPKWITNRAIQVYLLGLLIVSGLYFNHAMQFQFMLFGIVACYGFFYYANQLTIRWHEGAMRRKAFMKQLLSLALTIRVIYVVFSYFYYTWATGQPFMYNSGDEQFYHDMAQYGADLIQEGKFWFMDEFKTYSGINDTSDLGYATYLSYIYALTGKSIFLSRIIKAGWGAWIALLIYKLASRNFGESVGRMAGIVCAIAPNLIYYCGISLKEVEMVTFTVLFIERADNLIRSKKIGWKDGLIALLVVFVLFTFRTVLGVVAILAVGATLLLASERVMTWGKRLGVMAFAVAVLGMGYGEQLSNKAQELLQQQQSGYQKGNMEWRSQRKGGNSFAKYAGTAVFAPLIFTIPFPTIVNIEGQENQQMLNGGNFIKNIMSGFAILALALAIFSGDWRKHTLLWAFTLGYLAVIAMSAFAQSERFHQPVYPFIMMFACYGISQCTRQKYKTWYNYWSILMFLALVAWSWFKLKGRGY